MNVIALVDNVEVRIEALQFGSISRHAHAGGRDAIAGLSGKVVTIRFSADCLIALRSAAG